MTPEERASAQLFGMPDYTPIHPDKEFMLDCQSHEMITYNALVARFRAEEETYK